MDKNFKKMAFGDSLKMRFLVARKVFYTFLQHKVFMFLLIFCLLPLKLPAIEQSPSLDPKITISMDFQDANLKDVVKILSIQSGLNFIASEAVQDRKMTLFLDKVPIKEAMDKLFKANNLTYELDQEAKIFIVKDWGKPTIEMITKVFYLKHATVSTSPLMTERSSQMSSSGTSGSSTSSSTSSSSTGSSTGTGTGSSGGSSSGGSAVQEVGITKAVNKILSEHGSLIEDCRTNSLIVTDIPSKIPVIEKLIASLDVPVPQVLLEVEMLDVSKNSVDKIGFDFGDSPISILIGRAGGAGSGLRTFLGDVTKKAPQVFNPTATGVVAIGGTYAEVLDFLRTQTDTKYLARPRLLTLNNETAEIALTKDEVVGKKETNNTGSTGSVLASNVEYIRSTDLSLTSEGTGIFLRVTPQINLDLNEITMVINPKSSVTSTSALSSTSNPQSDVEVRTTKSIVKVKDGETIILGGLIHTEKNVIVNKVPILGDLPIIGAMFRHVSKTKDLERELIVFITPHIVRDTMEFAQAKKPSLLTKEQAVALPSERQSAIDASLNSFEKIR